MRQSDLHGDMESTAEMPVPRETAKVLLEELLRGVTSMNGPKVNNSLALVKLNHMRETPPQPFGTRRRSRRQ